MLTNTIKPPKNIRFPESDNIKITFSTDPLNNPGTGDLLKIKFDIFEGLDDYSQSPLNFADFTFNPLG